MIPQFPFIVSAHCHKCKKDTNHFCYFDAWDAKSARVDVTLICICHNEDRQGMKVYISEDDYEYLQNCVMTPNLN